MPQIRARNKTVSMPFSARMPDISESMRCHYLLEDQTQCPHDVMFDAEDMRVCADHARAFAAALMRVSREWFTDPDASTSSPAPQPPELIRHDLRRAKAVVYYVRFGNRIKIGTTINLPNRLNAIPHDEVLVTEPGTYDTEAARHQQFKHCHIANEWFDGTDPWLLGHIERLRRAQGLS